MKWYALTTRSGGSGFVQMNSLLTRSADSERKSGDRRPNDSFYPAQAAWDGQFRASARLHRQLQRRQRWRSAPPDASQKAKKAFGTCGWLGGCDALGSTFSHGTARSDHRGIIILYLRHKRKSDQRTFRLEEIPATWVYREDRPADGQLRG